MFTIKNHYLQYFAIFQLCSITLTSSIDKETTQKLKDCLRGADLGKLEAAEKVHLVLRVIRRFQTNLFGWNVVADGELFPNVPMKRFAIAPQRPTLLGVSTNIMNTPGLTLFKIAIFKKRHDCRNI